jgi:hypothetical protein
MFSWVYHLLDIRLITTATSQEACCQFAISDWWWSAGWALIAEHKLGVLAKILRYLSKLQNQHRVTKLSSATVR